MNPIPEPVELLEAECNALGLYGLPEAMPGMPWGDAPQECGADRPRRAAAEDCED